MKIKDPMTAIIESRLDIPSIIGTYFPEWMDIAQSVMCPFHEDTKPSLHIDPSGKGYCHGCHAAFRDIVHLVSLMEGCSQEDAKHRLYSMVVDVVPEAQVQAYVKYFKKKALDYLRGRNISDDIIDKFKLGQEPQSDRITIPIYDQFGFCVNIRRMGWLKEHRTKALNIKGKGAVRLFPEKNLIMERRIVLVEGEFDCLVGRALGLPTVTWTGGASNWNDEYTHLFTGKAVWLLYDNDRAGREGMEQAREKLAPFTPHIFQPEPPLGKRYKDLTDWSYQNKTFIFDLKMAIRLHRFPRYEKQVKVCPCCGQEIRRMR